MASTRQAWGLSRGGLKTGGIYRFSRNPQVVGWLLLLLGFALAGRSAAALCVAALYWIGTLLWLPREERVLESWYGDEYLMYRRRTAKYLGWPRNDTTGRSRAG
jgi:protein-S-isoprenylcysteine O-methyltransferase Ste14